MHVVEMMPQVLPIEDEEVANELQKILAKRGMKFHVGAKVESIKPAPGGYDVTVAKDGKSEKIATEIVLVAVGRKPCTEKIGLENTKVKLDRGYVKTDKYMLTDEPGIYAIGDIVPTPQLAHVASAEGILAVEHIAGQEPEADQLRPHPGRHLLRPAGRVRRPDREEGQGARLQGQGRQVPLRRDRQGVDRGRARGLRQDRRRIHVRRDPGRPHPPRDRRRADLRGRGDPERRDDGRGALPLDPPAPDALGEPAGGVPRVLRTRHPHLSRRNIVASSPPAYPERAERVEG
jgi:hypothetical protein